MKVNEIQNLAEDELLQKLNELKEEHLRLRCNAAIQQLQDVQMLKKKRRDIARVSTVLQQKRSAT